ncbi:MAG TPA: hypothetical protein PKM58_08380, partial [Pyrinomonadaceae bacterium]|nr:hypothetical protein [Pyrinomonadaceae bacterium]
MKNRIFIALIALSLIISASSISMAQTRKKRSSSKGLLTNLAIVGGPRTLEGDRRRVRSGGGAELVGLQIPLAFNDRVR